MHNVQLPFNSLDQRYGDETSESGLKRCGAEDWP